MSHHRPAPAARAPADDQRDPQLSGARDILDSRCGREVGAMGVGGALTLAHGEAVSGDAGWAGRHVGGVSGGECGTRSARDEPMAALTSRYLRPHVNLGRSSCRVSACPDAVVWMGVEERGDRGARTLPSRSRVRAEPRCDATFARKSLGAVP